MQTALDQGPAGQDNTYGYGVIQAYEAVIAVSALGRVAGVVTDGVDPINGARVKILSGPNQVYTDAGGLYYLALSDGTYDLEFSKVGFISDTTYGVVVTVGDTVFVNAELTALTPVVFVNEDFEAGAPGWTHDAPGGWVDNWHISTERANSGTHSYKCGDEGVGTYASFDDARLTSPVLSNIPASAYLNFDLQIESELSGAFPDSAYDGGFIELSVDAGPWTHVSPLQGYTKTFRYSAGGGNPYTGPVPGVACFGGINTTWTTYTLDLSGHEGSDVQVRFRFGSDANTNLEGWYVDDIYGVGFTDQTLSAPMELTILYDSNTNELVFNWQGSAPNYQLWSGSTVDGPYNFLEATTTNQTVSIPMPVGDQQYYVVVATD